MHVHAHHHQAHFLSVFSLLATAVERFTNRSGGSRLNKELWREGQRKRRSYRKDTESEKWTSGLEKGSFHLRLGETPGRNLYICSKTVWFVVM